VRVGRPSFLRANSVDSLSVTRNGQGCSPAPQGAGTVLEFRDLRKHFRVGDEIVRAVDGVSLRVDGGTMVALYGPSGSGKSTLLRIAAGIESADAGSVLVDGVDVTALSPRDAADYRMHVLGWVAQDLDLIDGASAVENAAFKMTCAGYQRRQARRAAAELLDAIGFSQRLEQRTETLSMGERQRVMLARALSLNPRVLLADEPTGNLDSRRTDDVLRLIQAITHERRMATLLVTHDERAMEYADKVYTLQDGVLSESPPRTTRG
jgi:putative ABC transport system ATP-binding protein